LAEAGKSKEGSISRLSSSLVEGLPAIEFSKFVKDTVEEIWNLRNKVNLVVRAFYRCQRMRGNIWSALELNQASA
jgi:hypothetical protein